MQAASIMNSASEYLIFRVESTQIQEGGIDCGHFAIAYATEFCFGKKQSWMLQVNDYFSKNCEHND